MSVCEKDRGGGAQNQSLSLYFVLHVYVKLSYDFYYVVKKGRCAVRLKFIFPCVNFREMSD